MTDAVTLLPSNATPFETAEELVDAARMPLSVDVVRAMGDARSIPLPFLPALGWGRGVDLWFEDWSVERKRDVVDRAIPLQRGKGKISGAREYLGLVDADLVAYRAPGTRAFARPAISQAERDAWLTRLPQIRVYLTSETGTRDGAAMANRAFAGHGFARQDFGEALYGRKARLHYPDGREVPLKTIRINETVERREGTEFERLVLPGSGKGAAFANRAYAGRAYATVRNRSSQILTYALNRAYDWKSSALHLGVVNPGLTPIDVNYTRVSERGQAGLTAFAGRAFTGRRYASEDRGADLLSDRLYLNDPSVEAPWVRGHSFANHTRLGVSRFTLELQVDANRPARRKVAFESRVFANRAYAVREDLTAWNRTLKALRASKAARDRYLVTTATRRRAGFGDRITLDGSYRFGGYVPASF